MICFIINFVGPDIFKFVADFFVTGLLPPGINSTHIALIPKVKDPKFVPEFRPISSVMWSIR